MTWNQQNALTFWSDIFSYRRNCVTQYKTKSFLFVQFVSPFNGKVLASWVVFVHKLFTNCSISGKPKHYFIVLKRSMIYLFRICVCFKPFYLFLSLIFDVYTYTKLCDCAFPIIDGRNANGFVLESWLR